jgi:hypothetical protein
MRVFSPREKETSEMADGDRIIIGQANTASNPGNETSLSRNAGTARTVFVARNLKEGGGIHGEALDYTGVFGTSDSGVGVGGTSNSRYGVWGSSGTGHGVRGTSFSNAAVEGYSSRYIGVDGFSDTYDGVRGFSNRYGVVGISISTNHAGVIGVNQRSFGVIGSTHDGNKGGGLFSAV